MCRKAKRETTDWYSALTEYLFFFKTHKPRDVVQYIGCSLRNSLFKSYIMKERLKVTLKLHIEVSTQKVVKVKAYKRVTNGKIVKVRSHYRTIEG